MPHVDRIILTHLFTWLIAAVISGIMTAFMAKSKGQNAIKWFFIGAIAPFVSLIALYQTKENPSGTDFYMSDRGYKQMRRWFAALISFIVFIVYAETAQPTVPFWDCGEFIACSYSLSVPHPPGASLFLLLGRLASMIPLDFLAPLFGLTKITVAHKMNLLSGMFNALAVGFLFLIITRATGKFFVKVNRAPEYAIVLISGFIGALLTAFAYTYWNNAVEAEVYGPAMMITNVVVYMAMLWYEKREKPGSDRYLVAIPYLLYLGIAIHLTTMVILPPIFLFIIFSSPEKRKDPFFWLTWIVLFSVATTFNLFLWAMAFGLVFTFIGTIAAYMTGSGKSTGKRKWVARSLGLSFITLFLAFLAFGIASYTLIRSAQDPLIDENDPETIEEFSSYMDRKQYGQQSMWELMFKRKGQWGNQFGNHPRMGFWGFFRIQWSDIKTSANGIIPFAIGLFGIFFFFSKHKRFWLLIFLSLLICTVGLILYINFSDGTQGIKLEVRDRDYFFTPGYMFFSAWIGIGIAAILAIFDKLRKQAKIPAAVTLAIIFLFTLLPIVPLKANWYSHDRSKNFIPHDYAFNILNSCDRNSVLFTNGDNDTFPLWFLQVVENVRADVCIANLSLLNTNWYIKQLKTRTHYEYTGTSRSNKTIKGKIWADNDLDLKSQLNARGISLLSQNILEKRSQFGHDFVPIDLSDDKIDRLMPYRTSSGEVIRVQDIMVKHLIEHTKISLNTVVLPEPDSLGRTLDSTYVFEPPIYFAVTVSPENKLNYGPYLRMEGLAYRLTGVAGERQVEPTIMKKYLFDDYLFRGLDDTTIYKDDNSAKLLQNYTTAFMTLALEFRTRGDMTQAKEVMDRALDTLPYDWRVTMFSADIYSSVGDWERFDQLFDEVMVKDSANIRLVRVFADVAYQKDRKEKLREIIEHARRANPDDETLFMASLGYMYQLGDTEKMNAAIEAWLEIHPDNEQLRGYMEQVKQKEQMHVIPKPQEEGLADDNVTVGEPAVE